MDFNKFIEQFLPEYNNKFDQFTINFVIGTCYRHIPTSHLDNFCKEYFSEALENFIDKICKKQRENCTSEMCVIDGEYDSTLIKNAEQPKIEEL